MRSEAAADRVDVASRVKHRQDAARNHRINGAAPLEQRTAVRPAHPFIRRRVGEKQMQALEDADERRDAGQLTLRSTSDALSYRLAWLFISYTL